MYIFKIFIFVFGYIHFRILKAFKKLIRYLFLFNLLSYYFLKALLYLDIFSNFESFQVNLLDILYEILKHLYF